MMNMQALAFSVTGNTQNTVLREHQNGKQPVKPERAGMAGVNCGIYDYIIQLTFLVSKNSFEKESYDSLTRDGKMLDGPDQL